MRMPSALKPDPYAPRRSLRSDTVGINVLHHFIGGVRMDGTTVNVFIDGRADSSHQLPGTVSLGEALIWYGTQLKLKGE